MTVTVIAYHRGPMTRWEPNASGRLTDAALELYSEHGYGATTVAEIAACAGLTERTYFRYFADKREVLFAGAEQLRNLIAGTVQDAPASATPLDALAAGLRAGAAMLQQRRALSIRRQAIIAANPELQERELIKLSSWAATLADVLRRRGTPEPAASLAAEAAMAAFRVAFARWIDAPGEPQLGEMIGESLAQLRAVTAA